MTAWHSGGVFTVTMRLERGEFVGERPFPAAGGRTRWSATTYPTRAPGKQTLAKVPMWMTRRGSVEGFKRGSACPAAAVKP